MTHQNKDKKIKNRSSLKDEFVFRDDHQDYDKTAYFLKSPKNAIRLLESMESLKERKIVETSLSELPQHHADPFDRMLISQAVLEILTLISTDNKICQYSLKIHDGYQ